VEQLYTGPPTGEESNLR